MFIKIRFINLRTIALTFFLITLSIVIACKENLKKTTINPHADIRKIPSLELFNSRIVRTDSGKATMLINAPLIQQYKFDPDSLYTLIPKGGKVIQYHKNNPKPITVKANWAHIDDKNKVYQGKGKVVMVNETDDTIKSEHVFWDINRKKIYSKVNTILIRKNKDSLVAKNGFEADDTFKNVKMYQTTGVTRNAKGKL